MRNLRRLTFKGVPLTTQHRHADLYVTKEVINMKCESKKKRKKSLLLQALTRKNVLYVASALLDVSEFKLFLPV